MKIFNIITAGLLLCAGLASCEMKDELKGGSADSSEMGYLDLGVAVNASQNNIARADEVTDGGKNENVGVSVSADDFPVTIAGVTDASYIKEYASYSALKEENKDAVVPLPVGSYTITAHTNAELKNEMSTPYYEGVEEISITKGVTAQTNVVCTMKNMKITLNYDTEFIANFTDWKITVTDGTTILTFECTDHDDAGQLNPAPKYMLVAEGVSQLTVRASGHNLQGEPVKEERLLTKPTGGNSTNWTGGDALTIKMEENTPSDPTGIQGSGITISADVSFDEEEETVEVPVTPGGGSTEEPGTGGDDEPEEPVTDDAPTLEGEYLTKTLTFDNSSESSFPELTIQMNVPNKIQDVTVTATSDNEMFKNALGSPELGLLDGASLINNETLGKMFSLPVVDETSYTFTLSTTLGNMLKGFVGNHSFIVKVTDQNSLSAEGTLKICIINSSAE